ncbi:MAG: outer membrane protein [Pseudomonadota bacterium]
MRSTFLKYGLASGLMLSAGAALAADAVELPPSPPPSAPIIVQEASSDWSGVYVGGFVNYGIGEFDSSAGDIDARGFEGGLFAGYNLDFGGYVGGVEADIALGDIDGELGTTGVIASKGLNGSIRARAGVDFDPILLYGTAGLAITSAEVDNGTDSDTNTHLGWTAGVGADAKITDSVFGRLEYRYTDYQSKDFDLGGTVVSSGFNEHSIRAGVGIGF